ncbi:MAG: tetratricopeptide repeat protein [Flavobacteriaceae bacterium]|nr:tetratricopeptide repeat protein [Flavobacteriaceae bacterium]
MNPQDLIEKYISGNLTAEETNEFNRLCEADIAFKEEVKFHENLQKVTAHEDNIAFKETLKTFEKEQKSNKRNPRIWWIAASFIGILIITYIFSFQQTSHEVLFAENFEPYRNVIQPIVRGEQDETLKTKAFVAYENKEYEKAIQNFSELKVIEKESYPIFYLANSYLALQDSENAISLLQDYINTEGMLKDKAKWYLGLSYLSNEETEKAISIFEEISNSKSYNHEKATSLLAKLK